MILKMLTISLRLRDKKNINFLTLKKSIKLFNHKENSNFKILWANEINNNNKF